MPVTASSTNRPAATDAERVPEAGAARHLPAADRVAQLVEPEAIGQPGAQRPRRGGRRVARPGGPVRAHPIGSRFAVPTRKRW